MPITGGIAPNAIIGRRRSSTWSLIRLGGKFYNTRFTRWSLVVVVNYRSSLSFLEFGLRKTYFWPSSHERMQTFIFCWRRTGRKFVPRNRNSLIGGNLAEVEWIFKEKFEKIPEKFGENFAPPPAHLIPSVCRKQVFFSEDKKLHNLQGEETLGPFT